LIFWSGETHEDHHLQVRAHLHSHAHAAFLSETDQRGCIRTPGFLAAVIPHFAAPPQHPTDWGWWTFTGPRWTPQTPPQLTDTAITILTVDADGVHAH
jgi:proteasome lid subunit RPN8/RPN11